MLFKDENGAEFELVNNGTIPNELIIRPVKQEPKYKVVDSDEDFSLTPLPGFNRCIEVDLNVSEDQAQLIKQSVELLMNFLFGDISIDKILFKDFHDKLEAARHSIKGGE